jgi:hypothetical protein
MVGKELKTKFEGQNRSTKKYQKTL